MKKIKITGKTLEIEGEVENKIVTPTGNSAHINIQKKHIGKNLKVIYPKNVKYSWIFSNEDLSNVVKICNDYLLNKVDQKMDFDKRGSVKNIQNNTFSLHDLYQVTEMLKEVGEKKILKKILKAYSI